jgi:hypothetical protein
MTGIDLTRGRVGRVLSMLLVVGLLTSSVGGILTTMPGTASATPHSNGTHSWEDEVIDGNGNVGGYTSAALDDDGHLHVAYRDFGNGALKYAEWDGSSWQIQTVDNQADVGKKPSLALDDQGNAHISYFDATNRDLKYASQAGGSGFSTTTVASQGDVGEFSSLALDSGGNPHIAYTDRSNGELEYSYHNGVSWIHQTPVTSGQAGYTPSIALDSNDDPHIVHHNAQTSNLEYARESGGTWSNSVVDSGANVGGFTSLALDGTGDPHVSYYDMQNSGVKYAVLDGGWQTQTVDSNVGSIRQTSLALDDGGQPHIAYRDGGTDDLNYVRYDGTSWNGGAVATVGDVGYTPSLVLDSHDTPLATHYNLSSGSLEVETRETIPTAPQSVSASPGDSEVQLSWSAPSYDGRSDVTDYEIYRQTSSGWQGPIATVSAGTTSHTVTGLSNGQQATFGVKAVNDVGDSPMSSQASATPRTTPDAPQSLSAQSGNGEVTLSWSAPANDGGASVTQYTIYRTGNTNSVQQVATVSGSTTSHTITGLANGQQYSYEVTATNAAGEGPASNGVSATPGDVPSAPQSLSADAGEGQIEFSWSAPADNGGSQVTDYRIYRVDGNSRTQITTVSGTSYTDTGLASGQEYSYEVTAVNDVGEGQASSQVTAQTVTPPSAPQSVQAEFDDGAVVLNWESPDETGGAEIDEYRVYRSDGGQRELLTTTEGNEAVDGDVTRDGEYSYQVVAVNDAGEGAPSMGETVSIPEPTEEPDSDRKTTEDSNEDRDDSKGGTPESSDEQTPTPENPDGPSPLPSLPILGGLALLGFLVLGGIVGVIVKLDSS